MGLSGISPMSLLLILAIIMLLFGTKRIGSIGRDLGGAIKQFKKEVDGESKESVESKDK